MQFVQGKGSFLETLCHNVEMKINLLIGHEIMYKQDPGLCSPFWLCACSVRRAAFVASLLHTGKAPIPETEERLLLLCGIATGAGS